MWNAWGISWGDSWGSSWGPLHEVESTGSRMRATTERKLKVIRDVRAPVPRVRASVAVRGLAPSVRNPAIPAVEVIQIAPVEVHDALPDPIFVPVVKAISARALANKACAAIKAGALTARAAVSTPIVGQARGCAVASRLCARASARYTLRQTKAVTQIQMFDDVYAERADEIDDEEDLLMLACAAL